MRTVDEPMKRKEYEKALGILLVKFWLEVSEVDSTASVVSSPVRSFQPHGSAGERTDGSDHAVVTDAESEIDLVFSAIPHLHVEDQCRISMDPSRTSSARRICRRLCRSKTGTTPPTLCLPVTVVPSWTNRRVIWPLPAR